MLWVVGHCAGQRVGAIAPCPRLFIQIVVTDSSGVAVLIATHGAVHSPTHTRTAPTHAHRRCVLIVAAYIVFLRVTSVLALRYINFLRR